MPVIVVGTRNTAENKTKPLPHRAHSEQTDRYTFWVGAGKSTLKKKNKDDKWERIFCGRGRAHHF